MKLEKQRQEILDCGKKLLEAGMVHDGAGNISIFDRESGLVAITPSALPYKERKSIEDIAVVDLEGNIIEGKWKTTVETNLHLKFYQEREDVNAVVHTHAPNVVTYSIIGTDPLPVVINEAAIFGGPIPVARWAVPGSQELADYTFEDTGDGHGAIMANHGLIAVGPNLGYALSATLIADATAAAFIQARSMGVEVTTVPEEGVKALYAMLGGYGPKAA